MNDQDEMFEAKTETPVAKLLACNERMRACVAEIAHLANECLLNTNHPNGYEQGQYGKDYLTYGKAICEILELVKEQLGESVPNAPMTPEEQSTLHREEARQKRFIHWKCYPTKVDIAVMGKTDQNGKVYEVRINKRPTEDQNTYWETKVNGHRVFQGWFEGSAWMAKRMLTAAMQGLVNYKAKRNRDSRRNYAKRARAARSEFENGGRA